MITFLNEIHSECLTFLNSYKKMIRRVGDRNKTRDNFYDEVYDVLCKGNDIDSTISQSQFDKTLPFNPYYYFINKMNYDAVEQMKKNESLRDSVLSLDADTVTLKELIGLFSEMERNVYLLNGKAVSKIRELEIRQNVSGRFIM